MPFGRNTWITGTRIAKRYGVYREQSKAKDCYRGEDLAAMTKAASSASRFSRVSAWMENIQGLSTLPHSVPYTGNRSAGIAPRIQ